MDRHLLSYYMSCPLSQHGTDICPLCNAFRNQPTAVLRCCMWKLQPTGEEGIWPNPSVHYLWGSVHDYLCLFIFYLTLTYPNVSTHPDFVHCVSFAFTILPGVVTAISTSLLKCVCACMWCVRVNLSISRILGAQNASPCMTHWLSALHCAQPEGRWVGAQHPRMWAPAMIGQGSLRLTANH